MNESYDAERSADINVAFKPRISTYMPKAAGDAVAGHGSPWDYDRRVPILFWWKGVRAQSPRTPIETVDIAPTLAAIANVATPDVDGVCQHAVAGVDACPVVTAR
jgi:predicted AlkP superfamily pyrophosphatase or phosphodiesterase